MNSRIEQISSLLNLYLKGELDAAQRRELDDWVRLSAANRALFEDLTGEGLHVGLHQLSEIDTVAAGEKLKSRLFASEKTGGTVLKMRPWRPWWAAAVAIVLLLGAGVYVLITNKPNGKYASVAGNTDIRPGTVGAILTLADGSQVSLDTIQNGFIALQGGAAARVVNGVLIYEGTGGKTVYNTMSTPKGRQFHLTLPDGTEVWLNAASSIRYPTVFTGAERSVEITGEAYFEVIKDPQMPFRLSVNKLARIEVLGTHFNVNAYDNEETINTTLMEGAVQVTKVHIEKPAGDRHTVNNAVLKPGQQATLANNDALSSSITIVDNVDINRVMAWKNGYLNFSGLSLEQIMRQLERWYDIEVAFEEAVPDRTINGRMTKDVPLSAILQYFEKINIHYRLEGRKVTILP